MAAAKAPLKAQLKRRDACGRRPPAGVGRADAGWAGDHTGKVRRARAISAWAVTHTGVCALVRE